ncbi:macrocin O-methyltransferase [Sphingomonas sp. HDW15A]|uniref:TylF/MycF/NovP-related O-methyltransferase n=1 Tax=Sphingomonas sp. HDW15A TaxID=2714942 RepID=UPI001409BFDD|nr:TylF/MycF/NovP-related O-methyltransferase [Sphingomonas sp. HDW15A]QIK95397.1 macrocin O-methyltransferase [Sphingomonas sp. HDW15A]
MASSNHSKQPLRDAYIDLLKRSITNFHNLGGNASFEQFRCVNHYDVPTGRWKIGPFARPKTLLSKPQLDLIERAVVRVEREKVSGDFIEAGIWRGGAVILMRALLDAYEIKDRRIFAADSFAGIPINTRAKGDPVDKWVDRWAAPLDDVKANIRRFGLLDDKVRFLAGFFADTLPTLTDERFALVRLDSDSYDSVETSLEHLYPRLSRGGVLIIDDWHLVGCRQAVEDYRNLHGIFDPVEVVDGNGLWVKTHPSGFPRHS